MKDFLSQFFPQISFVSFPPAFIKANFKFAHFNYRVILNFDVQNKSAFRELQHILSAVLKLREPLNSYWLFQT